MKLIEETSAFELISTFGFLPDFSEKEEFIFWLRKAGLIQEADELEVLSSEDFYDLFAYFLETHEINFIQ